MDTFVFGQLGPWGMLVLFGAVQGLIIGVHFLLRGRGDIVANRWLGLVLLLVSVHIGETVLTETALVEKAPWASGATWFLVFLVGPAYYFHVRRLVRPRARFGPLDLLHLLPALFILIDGIPWLTAPAETKIEWQRHLAAGGAWHMPPRLIAKVAFHVLQNGAYLVVSARLVRRAEERLAVCSADNDLRANLGALRLVIRWFGVWSTAYLLLFLGLNFWGTYGAKIDKTWLVIMALSVQATALVALNRPDAIGPNPLWGGDERPPVSPTDRPAEADPAVPGKYRNSLLEPTQLARYRQAFEAVMAKDKPYRDGALRLAELAELLGISQHHLSQMMNREMGRSFFDVINGYRVADVLRLMESAEYENHTLLAIAFEAGFNNKNSFNRAFKKETGVTPSVYWKRIRGGS